MLREFELAAPFAFEIFDEFCHNWLLCNTEVCMPCLMNSEKHLLFEEEPPKSGFLVFLHNEYGLLKSEYSVSEENVIALTQPTLAHRKERSSFRLGDVSHLLVEKDYHLLNISDGGCLLEHQSSLGTVLVLHFQLQKVLEAVAICVHANSNGTSGWNFPAWKFDDESKYRLAFGSPIPPLTQELQQLSAGRCRLIPHFKK